MISASQFAPEAVVAVLKGVPAAVGYWDRELRNQVSNEAYLEWFGFTPGEILGRHMREVLGDRFFTLNLPYITAVLAGERQFFDRDLVDVNGRLRHVQVSYIPDQHDGEVRGFVVLASDVTAHVISERELVESVARYRALARNMPTGFVLLFDDDLRFLVADGVRLAAFGFAREDLEGRTLHEAFPADLVAELEPRYRAALRGETVVWESAVSERTFRLTAEPVDPDRGTVSSGIVVAVDITEQRRNERSWGALHAIATEVARNGSPQDIAALVAHALEDVFAVDHAAVLRFTGPGSAEVLAMAPRHLQTLGHTVEFEVGDVSAIARVVETGSAASVRYVPSGGSIAETISSGGMRAGAAAPIRSRGEMWGAIALASSREAGLDDELVARLASFAELVELAIGNSEAWNVLSREAATDELTGLPNRRSFHAHLKREIERAHRHGRPLSLALMDVDHFKAVNDRFGHQAGDAVLAELGQRFRTFKREGELMARVGGEEFGWIIPESDGAAAVTAAERMRVAVADEPFLEVGPLSISIGTCSLADVAAAVDVLDALVAGADEALYGAKRGGRDCVVSFSPSHR